MINLFLLLTIHSNNEETCWSKFLILVKLKPLGQTTLGFGQECWAYQGTLVFVFVCDTRWIRGLWRS